MGKREELRRFFQEASKKEDVSKALSAHTDPDAYYRDVVKHGRDLGYGFTEQEVRDHLPVRTNRELNEQELNESAGGNFWQEMGSYLASPMGCH